MSEKKKNLIDINQIQEKAMKTVYHQLSRICKTETGYAAEYCEELQAFAKELEIIREMLLQKLLEDENIFATEEPCLLVPVCKGIYCYSVDEYTVDNNGSEISLVSSEKHFLYIDENHNVKEIQLSEIPTYIQ